MFHANFLPIRQVAWDVKAFFSGKNKNNIINVSSAELAQRVVRVKERVESFKNVHVSS